jgi:quercetin dioxygenase-like cupin family protein
MSDPATRLVVSQPSDDAFANTGLRPNLLYRKLGIPEATDGRVSVQVIRAKEEMAVPQAPHVHDLAFQFVYVLRGQARFWFEGHGEVAGVPGTAIFQPPGIVHRTLWASADFEIMEITMPAEFETRYVG